MNRMLFHREMESDCSTPLLFFIGCVLAASAFAIGTVMGFEFRDALQREKDRHKPMPMARPAVQNPPPPLINCADPINSREELSRICRHRWKSAQVGK